MKLGRLPKLLLLFVAMFALATVCFGQLERASLSGQVTDASGGVVPGAKVTALQAETGASSQATSDSAGAYNFVGLAVGTYNVTAEKEGFKTAVRSGVILALQANVRVDITLEVGAMTQQVTVSAPAAMVEERSSSFGAVEETKSLEQLPLEVSGGIRSMYSYLATVPGVQNNGFANNIYGGVGMYSEIVIDGVSAEYNPCVQGVAASTPDVDVVGEFKVVNSVNAEYGLSGGAFMNYVTKSGTNQIHGDAYEINRNTAFDGRGFYTPTTTVDHENEFGGSAGGPTYIPHLYNGKDKSWWFGNITRYMINSAGAAALYTMPTPKMAQGDFTEVLGPKLGTDPLGNTVYTNEIFDPTSTKADGLGGYTRTPYSCNGVLNTMCANQISSVDSKFISLGNWPLGTPGVLTNNALLATPVSTNRQYYIFFKEDQMIKKGRLTSSMRYFNGTSVNYNVMGKALDTSEGPLNNSANINFRAAYNRSIGSNWVTDTAAGMDRTGGGGGQSWPQRWDSGPGYTGTTGFDTVVGLKGFFIPCTPNTYISGYLGPGDHDCGQAEKDTNTKVNEIIGTFRGKHSIKFGASYYRWTANFPATVYANGLLNFRPAETGLPDYSFANTGWSFASWMAGAADTGYVQDKYEKGLRSYYEGFFVQDEFRATSKLTLNYGLRYEIQPQFRAPHNDTSEFNPSIPNAGANGLLGALEFASASHPRFADTFYKGFGPRLGFAYAITPRTVLRGSWGWFEAPVSQFSGELANRQGFDPSFGIDSPDGGITPAFYMDQGFPLSRFNITPSEDPTVANNSSTGFIGKTNAHPAQVQMINVGVQHQLPGQVLFDISYVGNMSHHISSGAIEQVNQLNFAEYGGLGDCLAAQVPYTCPGNSVTYSAPYPGFTGSVAQSLRPYPQYLGINGITSMIGNATYSSLYVKAQKRFSNGLSFLVGYVWSHDLGDVDSTPGYFAAGVQNAYNRRAEKAPNSNDYPQAITASYTYELPMGAGKRFRSGSTAVDRYVLGGWSIAGIHSYSSGDVLGETTNLRLPTTGDSLAQTQPNVRPNAVAGINPSYGISCGGGFNPYTTQMLNPAAFVDPGPFQFGNAPRYVGYFRGCGHASENISLLKTVPIKEKANLRFSMDWFNAFNRHQFGDPGTDVDNPTSYGYVSGAGGGRQIQLTAKILW